MADIRDWAALIRGRWDWTRFGYEKGFTRGCQFTDEDAGIEIDDRRLVIEAKAHDGIDSCEYPNTGQLLKLRDEVNLGKTVIVIYGCGVCNSPWAVRVLGKTRHEDRFEDWRERRKIPLVERRKLLKYEIDLALGISLKPQPKGSSPA